MKWPKSEEKVENEGRLTLNGTGGGVMQPPPPAVFLEYIFC